jgi:hypothetical protein
MLTRKLIKSYDWNMFNGRIYAQVYCLYVEAVKVVDAVKLSSSINFFGIKRASENRPFCLSFAISFAARED